MSAADLSAVLARLESIAARLEAVEANQGGAGGAPVEDEDSPVSLEEFDDIINEFLVPLVAAATALGGNTATAASKLQAAFAAQREFLSIVAQSKKPDDATFASLLGPTAAPLGEAIAVKDQIGRRDDDFNHVAAIAEAAPALGWVQTTKPAPHIKSMGEAGEFYANRALKDHKGEEHHVAYVKAFKGLWPALSAWAKKHHTTGPSWNPRGGDAAAATPAPAAAPAPETAPAEAAPAPAPAPVTTTTSSSDGPANAGLFAELNQGGAVTSGLKKVTRDMTNKGKKVNAKVDASAIKKTKKKRAKGAPVFELQGNKWMVENQDDQTALVIEAPQRNQTVYLYKLDNCVVQIKGKVNSICVDSCWKTGLVFTDAVSVVEVINCKSVQVQVTGRVPSVNVDKTSGCQIFLSEEALDAEIISSKTDEMNVVLPPVSEDADITECAVPEQFRTTVDAANRAIVTEVVQHIG